VLVLSADVGSGHLVAGRALAAELRDRGVEVVVEEDLGSSLGLIPRLVIREGSRLLFAHGRPVYDGYYWLLRRCAPFRALSAALLRRSSGRRLLRLIRRHRPDAVVSTYPGVTVVLGQLRRRRKLSMPVLAVITDLTGLFFWAHRGVDTHLLAWEESAAEVRRIARADSSIHVLAPTDPAFFEPVERRAARERCGLPADGSVAIVSGGGWGVGGLEDAVRSVLAADPERVVAIAGANEGARTGLERSFGDDPRVTVLGYTDQMSDLLAAADVLVHATGGVTCLEAALRGCPTVIYGFAIGHVRHNANEMNRLGLASRARDAADLTALVGSILRRPPVAGASPRPELPSAAEVVSRARPLITPLPRWRLALRRISPAGAALGLVLAMSTTAGYAIAARFEDDLKPVQHVSVGRPEVALVARPAPDAADALLEQLAAERLRATVAVTVPPPAASVSRALRSGVELVPGLDDGQRLRWFATSDRLADLREGLREPRGGPYVVPSRGFTLGQYVLGRTQHGKPVRPLREPAGAIHSGDIVEADSGPAIERITAALAARGIGVTTLSDLLAG
jgi:processive 1,2-diacylglycerol beta-glucosyltransferase